MITTPPTISLSVLGRPARLQAPDELHGSGPHVMAHLRRLWARCIREDSGQDLPQPSDDAVVDVPAAAWSQHELVARQALSELTQEVTRVAIHGGIGRFLMFHAAALAHTGTGDALAFVARGGTGKTTLARNLGHHYAYVTDETVAVHADGRLEPYAKPLSIRVDDAAKVETSPDELGLLRVAATPRLVGLVLLDRRPDSDAGVEVTELDLFDAIPALVPETSSLARLDRPLQLLADLIGRTGDVQRWTYGDHTDLSDLVAERLGRP